MRDSWWDSLHPGSLVSLSWQHAFAVLPHVAVELDRKWRPAAAAIPDTEIRKQALASLRAKRFHAEGGSCYALTRSGANPSLVALIVAIQTISDYLDNLCDRSGAGDPADFRLLHQAWLDAFAPGSATTDYYRLHPEREDGGYLESLVRECRRNIALLPSYPVVAGHVQRLAGLYADLQVYKHQHPLSSRLPALERWHAQEAAGMDLHWWEFAAASGSTLGIFALLRAAAQANLRANAASAVCDAYFPYACATHILLDYFIDQAEDVAGGDLNLVSYYRTPAERDDRLRLILESALDRVASLPDSAFHSWIVTGLPVLYLSDHKVRQQNLADTKRLLVSQTGTNGRLLQVLVRMHKLTSQGRKTYRYYGPQPNP